MAEEPKPPVNKFLPPNYASLGCITLPGSQPGAKQPAFVKLVSQYGVHNHLPAFLDGKVVPTGSALSLEAMLDEAKKKKSM